MTYEYDEQSKVDFTSVNSLKQGSSIKQSDQTLSKMKFTKSDKTDVDRK